ncbi:MAG: tetratricopeptide repeat protein [Planctomycetota bacterium]
MGFLSSIFRRKPKSTRLVDKHAHLFVTGGEAELVRKVGELVENNQLDAAAELLRQGTQHFPACQEITTRLTQIEGRVLHQVLTDSLAQIENDGSAALRAEIAELYRRTGRADDALTYGRMAIQADPNSAAGYRAVGRVYFERFRASQSSVDGHNALRYLSKAHGLQPSNSLCLLQLCEIFVILRAPTAAERFLGPVRKAFGSDPRVRDLSSRVADLPPEATIHIQDLFLRHERRLRGEEQTVAPAGGAIPFEVNQVIEDKTRGVDGTTALYLVGGDRCVKGGYFGDRAPTTEAGESLGVFTETLQLTCKRMALGEFSDLVLKMPTGLVIVKSMPDALTAYYIGNTDARQAGAENLLDKVTKILSAQRTARTR